MDNNLNSHKHEASRGSISSTTSLELPLTPTRTIKKVSFSDEKTTTTTTPTASYPTMATATAESPEDIQNDITIPPLMEFMAKQTQQYLEKLHDYSSQEEEEVDNRTSSALSSSINSKKNIFTSSLNINLSSQDEVNKPVPPIPPTRLRLNLANNLQAKRKTEEEKNISNNHLTELQITDNSITTTPIEYHNNSSRSSSLTEYATSAKTLSTNSRKSSISNHSTSTPPIESHNNSSRASSLTEDGSTFSTVSTQSQKSFFTSQPSSKLPVSYDILQTQTFHDNFKINDSLKGVKDMERFNLTLDKTNFSSMELEARRDKMRWLLISECSAQLGDGKYTREGFRKLFLDEDFQQKFFQLFDFENNSYLMQDRWIEHLKGRLIHDREMDYAEQLESVAYVICGENSKISFKNFYDIWHARGIFDKLYRLIDKEGTNLVSTSQIMEFLSNLTNSRPRTGFDKSSLARLEQLFRNTVGNEQEIRREEFKKIVISKNPFFTERVFQIFDKDNSGSISLQEFIDAIHQFSGQSADDKIRFLFKVYDIDGDGLIQHKELHDVIRACMEENGMEFSEEQIEDLTIAMFEDADPYNRGEITYEALKNQLHKHGGLLENLSITIDRWLVPITQTNEPKSKTPCINRIPVPHQLTPAYMKNNHVFVTYLAAYIVINVCLFVSRSIQYRSSNIYVILARACGQCLNFNCAWILVLMLRHTLTYLRSNGLSTYLPVDNHIYLHKMTGFVISIFSLIHTVMHLCNFSMIVVNDREINKANFTVVEWLLTDRPGLFGLVPGCANPTGVVLFIILLIMFICSQPFVRRKGSFEVFYWTHLLYVPFWILLLFHGPNFWKWYIIPGFVYVVERVLRYVWMRGEHGKTYISSGLLLPSKVIHLVIKRPYNFNFRPGDYVFVNIPTIAKYEWHPFTISSAPEQEDYMWLHIRTVGEWTNRLYRYFEREHHKLHNGPIMPHKQAIPTSSLLRIQENSEASPPVINSQTPQTDFLAKNLQRNGKNHENRIQRQNFIPSKLATQNINACDTNAESNGPGDRIRNLKQTLQRTFSRKDAESKEKRLSCHANDAFVTEDQEGEVIHDRGKRKKLQRLLLNRPPLEKSISLPDMAGKTIKRSHLKTLQALGRSESERSFDQARIRRTRLHSDGLAYLSPQNRSLAQSFRYMRNKPTIIAFKAPKRQEKENDEKVLPTNDGDTPTNYTPTLTQNSVVEKFSLTEKMNSLNSGGGEESTDYVMAKPLEDEIEKVDHLKSAKFRRRGTYATLSTQGTCNPNGNITLDEGISEIFIDGPYGAPSSHIFMAQHAVLIGTGIGVTPFASILQSIMHRYWKVRHTCPRCNYEWSSEIPKSVMNLRKVDFFWINRDQRSFEWFVNLLSQLEIEQAELGGAMERFLDMHMYITSALQKTDMKAVCLQLALDLLHEKGKRDLITGLKTRTNAGRPNWDKVFKQLQAQKKGKVTIFYCGPPQLAKTLRYKCDEYGFTFRKECF